MISQESVLKVIETDFKPWNRHSEELNSNEVKIKLYGNNTRERMKAQSGEAVDYKVFSPAELAQVILEKVHSVGAGFPQEPFPVSDEEMDALLENGEEEKYIELTKDAARLELKSLVLIDFYGGEALLQEKALGELVTILKQKLPEQAKFKAHTNGLLFPVTEEALLNNVSFFWTPVESPEYYLKNKLTPPKKYILNMPIMSHKSVEQVMENFSVFRTDAEECYFYPGEGGIASRTAIMLKQMGYNIFYENKI